MHNVKGYDIRLGFKEGRGGHSMHNVKGHDIRLGFKEGRGGNSMHNVKGYDIGFVSKREGEVIPCTMSRGMT